MWRLTPSAVASLRRARRFSAATDAATSPGPCIVRKRGADILQDPWFNKDTAFPLTERDRLGLRGLLPPRIISFKQQYARFMESYRSLEKNTQGEPEEAVSLAKWRILNRLHDRNETLYFGVLIDNIKDFAPIVYTPTVGLVCQNYSGLFRRPRGMYFSARDKGEMMSMIYNWPAHQVDMIVVTDGSRILGLGDLGVHGIGIPIGKLDMYVAAAGMNPQRVLPVMLDVGTNNQKLLEDHLGLRQPRLEGEEYLSVVDEFMEAVHRRWPKAIVQTKWAFETLHRYRKRFCMFNVDIQGTAGVVLAGLLGAVRAQGRPVTDFVKQKIVVVGAGSAGLGVLNMAVKTVSRLAGANGLPKKHNFYLIDKDGLITKERKNLDPAAAPFARDPDETEGLREGASLVEVVRKVKPDVLLGLSGVGGIFTEEVLRAIGESDCPRPAIFAMSNPTANAECTAADAFKYAGEHILFASGSPFKDVTVFDDMIGNDIAENGKLGHVNQANNMYLFPGIGLGALLSGARYITDEMLQVADESLASYMTDEETRRGILYPSIASIREITAEVAAAVMREAAAQGLAEGYRNMGPKDLSSMSKARFSSPLQPLNFYRCVVRHTIRRGVQVNYGEITKQTYELAEECLRILRDADKLAEENTDEILSESLRDFKDSSVVSTGWPLHYSPYMVPKAALNVLTGILAKKWSSIIINATCTGFMKTDMTAHNDFFSVEAGGAGPTRLALIPSASPSGPFYASIDDRRKQRNRARNKQTVSFTRDITVENLNESGVNPDDLVFHRLDVTDSNSIATLADFIKAKFGKLDILVNDAGINSVILDSDALAAAAAAGTLIPREKIRKILGVVDNLTEEKIYGILKEFLGDFKDGWPSHYSAYITSKAALNTLTIILAKKYPSLISNAICPGFVKTDMTGNSGFFSVEEGGASPTRLALMPPGSPSGLFYVRFEVSSFDE
ncbi:hypothetical protein Cgig2_033388 [Carnegiea gigantea]|uniref:Malic enzyme n=1 Tax=Carnegiea gigantea TaxID=171969 RepID=A0A9Q1QQ97_9CARY|nr:hypothetical protein Cgig2_033388 [Carnegiea gigantea]